MSSNGQGINMYWNTVKKVTGQDMAESLLAAGEDPTKLSFSFNQGENKNSLSMVSSASVMQ